MRGMKIMILPLTMYNYELIFFCLNCHARWVCLVFIICREYQHVLNVSSVSSCFSSTKKKNCDVARVIWNAFLFNCTWRHKPALCLSADIPSHVDRLIEHWNKRVEIQTVCDGMCAVLTYCEYVCVFVCVCVLTDTQAWIYISVCVCVCVCEQTLVWLCVCVCVRVCVVRHRNGMVKWTTPWNAGQQAVGTTESCRAMTDCSALSDSFPEPCSGVLRTQKLKTDLLGTQS